MPDPKTEFQAEVESLVAEPIPVEARNLPAKKTEKDTDLQANVELKGTYAQSHVFLEKSPKTFQEMVAEAESKQTISTALPNINDTEAKALSAPKKESFEDIVARFSGEKNAFETKIVPHFPSAPKTGEGILKSVLTVLSADEHAIVKGIYAASGLDDSYKKNDFSEYNYGNMLRDLGMEDNGMTTALGLGMSVFLSPSTYLTFGAGGAFKLGVKGVGKAALTKSGQKVRNSIIAKESKKQLAALTKSSMAKHGHKPFKHQRDGLFAAITKDVDTQLIKKFSGESKDISLAIKRLPSATFDRGGMKFMGIPVLGQQKIVKTLDDAALPQVIGPMGKVQKTVAKAPVDTKIQGSFMRGMKNDIILPITDSLIKTKALFSRMFIHRFEFDKNLVGLWESTEKSARGMNERIIKRTEQWFKGLDDVQRSDFAESALQASRVEDKIEVKSLLGDRKVQDRLDRFYGQGKFGDRKGMADVLAKKAEVFEDAKLANWFPGIDQKYAQMRVPFRLPKDPAKLGPANRLFNEARTGDLVNYVKDPVRALAIRRTQIAHANLQDDLYESLIAKKFGDVKELKEFKNAAEANALGFSPLNRPFSKILSGQEDIATRSLGRQYWAKKEFVDQYDSLIKGSKVHVPVISWATNIWKRHVTSIFPAFHARNFMSNVVLNAMRIGGHAVDPRKIGHSVQMLRYAGSTTPAARKALKEKIRFETGEVMTRGHLFDEAIKEGVIDKSFYVADLGGELMQKEAQERWTFILSKANPMSPNFLGMATGRKFGQAVESQARLVNYMTWRQKGLNPKAAMIETNEALYNYGALTEFEQYAKVMVPFWTFGKKNLENHIKILGHRPGAVISQMKFIRDVGPNTQEWEGLPDWAKNRAVARINGTYLSGFGLPVEDVLELTGSDGRDLMLRSNPMFRFAVERSAGKDFFSNRDLIAVNSAKEFGVAMDILDNPNVPSALKVPIRAMADFLNLERDPSRPDKIIGDPTKLHVLRSSFTTRYQSTLSMVSDQERSGYESGVRFITGVVRLPLDYERQARIVKGRMRKKMENIAQKYNTARPLALPVFYGGGKMERDIANWYMQEIMKGNDSKEMRFMTEQFELESAKLREARGP